MVSTPEEVTDDSTDLPIKSTPFKKLSARKSLCLFTNIFDFKKKAAKRNQNIDPLKWVISSGPIKRKKGYSKINDHINRYLYAWITRHPQVVQTKIYNDCLKVMLDDQSEPQLVPKLVLHVSVRELHNILVSDPHDGGIKDSREEDDNIIISDYTLRSLLPPKLKQISAQYKIMCGCECCIYAKIIHS